MFRLAQPTDAIGQTGLSLRRVLLSLAFFHFTSFALSLFYGLNIGALLMMLFVMVGIRAASKRSSPLLLFYGILGVILMTLSIAALGVGTYFLILYWSDITAGFTTGIWVTVAALGIACFAVFMLHVYSYALAFRMHRQIKLSSNQVRTVQLEAGRPAYAAIPMQTMASIPVMQMPMTGSPYSFVQYQPNAKLDQEAMDRQYAIALQQQLNRN